MTPSLVKLSKISWEFKDADTRTLTHGYHPFHAKFIPQIPRTIIEHLTKEGHIVLDPFCGSGTTLVEAHILRRNTIGIDISPLAVLVSKVKTTFIDPDKLEKAKNELYQMIDIKKTKSVIPDFPDQHIWYNKETLQELGIIWGQVILKTVANRSEHWNWAFIGDNILPKLNKYTNPNKYFKNTLERMIVGMKDFQKTKTKNWIKVLKMNTKDISKNIKKKVDLIITSPPYCFAVDFNRYYRLSYYWFNWEIDKNRDIEIGARSKRAKKCGIDDYFFDMGICIKEFYNVLNKDGYCCFTLGNTKRDNKEINTVERTIGMCLKEGFQLVDHTHRELSKQSMAQKRIPREAVLIFKK